MSDHKEQAAALIEAGSRDALALQLLNATGRSPHDLVLLCQLAQEHHISTPVRTETLRALNSHAVQFRYESCAVELVASSDCEAVAECLATWVREAFNQA
jgi:hypothetical protein